MQIKKSVSVLMLFFAITTTAIAQKDRPWNLQNFDQRKYHFGFILAYNSTTLNIDYINDNTFNDSILSIEPDRQPGFDLAIVGSLNLTHNINLKFMPGLAFQDRNIKYTVLESNDTTKLYLKKIESTWLTFPLVLKLRTDRINNFAAYALGGYYYSVDMAGNRDVENKGPKTDLTVLMKKHDHGYQVGGGFDFFLPYFKFGIELKLVNGVRNILLQDNSYFANPLKSVRNRSWVVSLTFEG